MIPVAVVIVATILLAVALAAFVPGLGFIVSTAVLGLVMLTGWASGDPIEDVRFGMTIK